jgi:hypothetical protein
MLRKPFRLFAFPAIVLLATFALSIPTADAAATYSVRDLGELDRDWDIYHLIGNTPIERLGLTGMILPTYKDGKMILRGDSPSKSPAPPAGMGDIYHHSFTSPNGQWRVATAFAAPVGQVPVRGYIQSASGTEERIFEPTTNLKPAFTTAVGVNDSGFAVGTVSGGTDWGDESAVRYNPDGTMTMLGTKGEAMAINNSGLIVGTTYVDMGWPNPPVEAHGFLYDSGKLLDLDQFMPSNLGLRLVTATDILDDGQIVAFGRDATGLFYHELLLTPDSDSSDPVVTDPEPTPQPIPEPASVLVFGVIAVSALALKRRIGQNAA